MPCGTLLIEAWRTLRSGLRGARSIQVSPTRIEKPIDSYEKAVRIVVQMNRRVLEKLKDK